ncbi:MAG TPA: PrsW family intramembrane metalloprotease, partial [Vicinamibacterales bacterium]|nr:PrsW family intramembrane metalloprotease [Vicinamibacterales bacterium]
MIPALTIAFVVVPSFLLLAYFRARDLNPEPARMLWKTFAWGVAICIPVIPVEMAVGKIIAPLTALPYEHGLAHAMLGAAVPEELFKFAVVVLFCMRSREFDEPMDGVVYGAVASLGFASLENLFYVAGDAHSLRVAILRAVTAVPGHAFMGAIMGYYAGQARFGGHGSRVANWARAFTIPVALHTLYDFPALTQETLEKLQHGSATTGTLPFLTIAVLVFEWRMTVRLVHSLRFAQIAEVKQVVAAVATEMEAADVLAAMAQPDPLPTAGPGWAMAIAGAIAACGGGLFSLLIGLGFATSAIPAADARTVV